MRAHAFKVVKRGRFWGAASGAGGQRAFTPPGARRLAMPPDHALLASPPAALETEAARAPRGKLLRRTLPICCLLTTVTYIDRSNLGLAAPTLIADGVVTRLQFGWSAASFFVSYGFLQIPMATCFTTRIGMGRWFAVTVGLWGATTAATAAVRGPGELIALRVLLGLFEAGTLPGCYCLLSRFHTVRMGVVGRVEGGERQKRVPPPPPDPPPTPPPAAAARRDGGRLPDHARVHSARRRHRRPPGRGADEAGRRRRPAGVALALPL